jgi:hypothetical protein
MPENPYLYGVPVTGKSFAGREDELRVLVARVRSGINVALIAPRRLGKSSLVAQGKQVLEQGRPKAAVMLVNALQCATPSDLAGAFASGAYRLPGGWRRVKDSLAAFLGRLRISPTLSIGHDGSPVFGFDPRLDTPSAVRTIESVFALMAELAKDRPACVVVDEFQAVTGIAPNLPGVFKALADRYGTVSLVVAGSHHHMMEGLVLARSSPLYGMTEPIFLAPIDRDVMVEFIARRARESGKPMTREAAAHLVDAAAPAPNDIQRLAFEAWDMAKTRVNSEDVDRGLSQAVKHQSANYAQVVSGLTPNQHRVLRALAQSPTSTPHGAHFVRRADVANASSVGKALRALELAQLVVNREGRWDVDDPFLREWLRSGTAEPLA